ncbi:MAG: acyl-CoA thioesterase [Cyclonatronaceae bacterium]
MSGLKSKEDISGSDYRSADNKKSAVSANNRFSEKSVKGIRSAELFPGTNPIFQHSIVVRCRYGETDKMGYLYHARYIDYFDVARTEMIRLGEIDYKQLEDSGIIMPVLDVKVRYFEPVFYDEEIRILVHVYEWPETRLHTHYKVTGTGGKLKAYGRVSLCFVNEQTRKPVRVPQQLLDAMQRHVQY